MRTYLLLTFMIAACVYACQKSPDQGPSTPTRVDSLNPGSPGPLNPPPANDSLHWQKVAHNMGTVWHLHFVTPAKGFAATYGGLYGSVDSGKTWNKISVGVGGVNDVFFLNSAMGYYAGNNQSGYTLDGGTTWTTTAIQGSFPREFNHMRFSSPSTGYITCNDGLLQTVDTGKTWSVINRQMAGGLGLHFDNLLRGWVTKGGSIYKTLDGGTMFSLNKTGNSSRDFFYSLHFTDSLHGWVNNSGNSYIYKTINGGLTWETANTPAPSVDIHFINNNVGFIATQFGVSKSSDGGKTWKQMFNDSSASYIYETYFFNEKTGWAIDAGKNNIYRTIP